MTVAGREPSAGTLFVIVMSWPAAPKRRLITSRPPFVPLAWFDG